MAWYSSSTLTGPRSKASPRVVMPTSPNSRARASLLPGSSTRPTIMAMDRSRSRQRRARSKLSMPRRRAVPKTAWT